VSLLSGSSLENIVEIVRGNFRGMLYTRRW
jgi:hypothetical protein